MDIDQRINELAHEAGKYIRAQAMAAGMRSDTPVAIQGHMEIAMRKLADELLAAEREVCAKLVHARLGADGYGVAQMIRARSNQS